VRQPYGAGRNRELCHGATEIVWISCIDTAAVFLASPL
jgi:hypothetical protein